MKKIAFLIVACLLLGMTLMGCVTETPEITIAVVGPLSSGIEGRHMWWGADLAGYEINEPTAGQPGIGTGINVGGTIYNIKLLSVDIANSGNSPAAAMNDAITSGAQFIIGGWTGAAVAAMIPVAMTNNVPFFIDGDATYSQLSGTDHYDTGTGTPYYPYSSYANYSPDYKYIFRGTPMNDVFLGNSAFLMTTMVAKRIGDIIGANTANPVKIAILAENLDWDTQLVNSAQRVFGVVAPGLGWPWQLVGTWKVSPTATDMASELSAIQVSGAHIIFTIFAGLEGVVFGAQKGAMGIPAIAVGINLRAQYPGYWTATSGGAEYEITTATWAPSVKQTSNTAAFLSAFQAWTDNTNHEFPIFTAASYDIIYDIKVALEGRNSIDKDDIIDNWLEAPVTAARVSTTGPQRAYYPRWGGSTTGKWTWTNPWDNNDWPALTSSQIGAIYGSSSHYSSSCEFTMAPYTTHDLIYGPTWETGIGSQWLNDGMGDGIRVGVWPNDEYCTPQDTMSRAFAGIGWGLTWTVALEYSGTTDFVIPDWMCRAWTNSDCPSYTGPCP